LASTAAPLPTPMIVLVASSAVAPWADSRRLVQPVLAKAQARIRAAARMVYSLI
jgi:hypothetical protein